MEPYLLSNFLFFFAVIINEVDIASDRKKRKQNTHDIAASLATKNNHNFG